MIFGTSWRRGSAIGGFLAVAALMLAGAALPPSLVSLGPTGPHIRGAGSRSAIPGSYIVMLKDDASVRSHGVFSVAQTLTAAHHGKLGHALTAQRGFSVQLS